MAISSLQVVTGYYNSLGTPAINTAVTAQLGAGWIPHGAPVLTDVYGQVAQVMVKSPGLTTTAYSIATGASPMAADATWDALGDPLWIDSTQYLQAYTKGAQVTSLVNLTNQVSGILPVTNGGTGGNTVDSAKLNLGVYRFDRTLDNLTTIYSTDSRIGHRFILYLDGYWGVLDEDGVTRKPLSVDMGGTGSSVAATAWANLGGGSIGKLNVVSLTSNVTGTLPVTNGGTGATSATTAWTNLGGGSIGKLNIVSLTSNVTGILPVASGGTGSSVAATAWTNLGGGSIGKLDSVSLTSNVTGTLPVTNGGTGATSATAAWTNLGGGSIGKLDSVSLTSNVIGTLPIASGGTGATSATTARDNLGLGTAATRNVGSADGNVLAASADGNAAFGLSSSTLPNVTNGTVGSGRTQLFRQNNTTGFNYFGDWGAGVHLSYADTVSFNLYLTQAGNLMGTKVEGGSETWRFVARTTRNTTVDTNGFIKVASPIIILRGDGSSDLNDESEGAVTERVAAGVYSITGVLGFNSDDTWHVEVPKDVNGQPLIWVDYSVKADGSIEVRTYHREHPNAPIFARNTIDGFTDGDAIDIPQGKSLTLRVNMPDL